jgi:NADH:ubiquinone oxidoreductase subunit B-like Fe-S oxidoreductase
MKECPIRPEMIVNALKEKETKVNNNKEVADERASKVSRMR